MTAPVRRAPALLRSIGEHFAKLSQRLHVDASRNLVDASRYAVDALRDVGFRVVEEPFTKMVRRPYNRDVAAGIWFVGSTCIAAATLLLASGKYTSHMIPTEGVIAVALSAWTVLLDRWYSRKSHAVPSTNIVAARGAPSIWLVGSLTAEAERKELRLRPVLEIILATVIAILALRTPGFAKIAWLLPVGVGYGALHWFLRRRFSARTSMALEPATGAAAILAACEQLAPNQDVGIVLTRDSDPEGRALRWALAGRRDATTIVVGQVGGPEELHVSYSKGARAIATRMESAAGVEQLHLDVAKVRLRASVILAGLDESTLASAALSRPTTPVLSRHLFARVFSRAEHKASFDPVEQIAKASRLLVRTVEDNSREPR